MAKKLYVTAMEPQSGKSVVSLGLMELLSARVDRLGFFRPIVPATGRPDPQIELIRRRYQLSAPYEEMHALTEDKAAAIPAYEELRKHVVAAYKQLEQGCEFVLCEGTDFTSATSALDYGLNADLANELGAPVLVVLRGGSPTETLASVRAARNSLAHKGCTIFGIVVNRVPAELVEELERALAPQDGSEPIYVLPELPELAFPINVQRGGPSTGLPTNVEQSDLFQAIFGGHGDSPRVVLAAATVEDCFYIAIEAARIARKYSTPVFILSDTSLATRIEAFHEPELKDLMIDPKLDLSPRPSGFKPYAVDQITQHATPGAPMIDGKYPLVSGLEHDEMGHPTGSPKLHMAMTAKRRNKLRKLAEEIPVPEVYGDQDGGTLLVGWGSTYGPIHDAVKLAREHGEKAGALHLRHVHPLPNGLEKIFAKFKRIVVVEMNDQGIYGFGQLATLLRARFCEPKIESATKTDGLTFRVKEILERVFEGRSFAARNIPREGVAIVHADTSAENVKTLKEVVPQGVG